MKKTFALALAFSATALPVLAAPPPPVPAPKILVFDRNYLLTTSKVGQDMARQVRAFGQKAKSDLDAQAKGLEAQGQALQQQVAVLAPDVKAQRIKDFEGKQAALQRQAQSKEATIQYSAMAAQQQIAKELEPILKQLMA